MITVITGAPGSGKSAALVSLIAKLSADRAVFVNGIPGLTVPHQVLDDPTTWHETVPDGSIVVIDEVQRVWRPRGPGQRVPDHIAALEIHRHRGLDFYIITQAPRLIDTNVRALVGRHIHLRDIGILGRWWYEWPEIAENCNQSWKQAPIKKRYRLPKAAFDKYKSASVHIKPIRSIPWVLFVLVFAVLGVGYLSWSAYQVVASKMGPVPAPLAAPATPGNPLGLKALGAPPGAPPGPSVAYDYAAFIPRVSSKPETAPAYDHLRQVVSMPVVAGGLCMRTRCKCITQQGSDAGLTSDECRAWLDNAPFNPYRTPDDSPSDKQGMHENRVANSVNPV